MSTNMVNAELMSSGIDISWKAVVRSLHHGNFRGCCPDWGLIMSVTHGAEFQWSEHTNAALFYFFVLENECAGLLQNMVARAQRFRAALLFQTQVQTITTKGLC